MKNQCYVYIIYSQQINKYYTGLTFDIKRRMSEHARGQNRSTRTATDWKTIYCVDAKNPKDARALEKKIKARGAHRYIHDLNRTPLDLTGVIAL